MRRRWYGFSTALAALLALVVAAASCTSQGGPAAAPSGSAASPSATPVVSFETKGGDAFAWSERVSGTARCDDVALLDNGSRVGPTVAVEGTSFSSAVPLGPGANRIVARCTGTGVTEESAPLVWQERLTPGPTARIDVHVQGETVVLDGGGSTGAVPDGARIVDYAWRRDPAHPSPLTLASGRRMRGDVGGRTLRLQSPAADGEYYASLTATDAKGRRDTSTTYFVVRGGAPHAVDMMHEHPSWIDSAVLYAPIPALWGNGGPKAVDRRLPYLKELGVDALWLWPPAEERAFGEEYAITDYYKLDPSWGPASAFKKMVDDAHRLGMHVLLDIVPNHMSDQSPYFKDAETYGTRSHYYDFFDRDAQGEPTHYFDWTNLPNLNYDNPEVRNMVTGAFVHWVRDFGIDGFRVDAAWGVQRRRPSYWPELRRAVKRVNPDVLMLAEGSAVDPYFFSHGFDVAYDWTNHPGQWQWASVFNFPQETGVFLGPAITNGRAGYAPDAIVLRFLNNNDTGIRFVDQFSPELTRVAATLQFTVPGMPALFAGDEIGASYDPYSNLVPIDWKDRFGLRPLYKQLIELKHDVPSLNSHDVDVLDVSDDSAFTYIRPAFGGGPPVLVLLNFGSKLPHLEITKDPEVASVVGDGVMHDLLTGRTVHLTVDAQTVSHEMDSESMYVLVPGAA